MLVSSLSLACQDVVFPNRWPLFTQFFLVWVCLVRVFFGHGMWIHLFHFLMVIIPFFFWGMSTRGGKIHQWSPPLSQHSKKPSQIVGFSPTASPLNGLLESGISKASINSCTPIQGWFTLHAGLPSSKSSKINAPGDACHLMICVATHWWLVNRTAPN